MCARDFGANFEEASFRFVFMDSEADSDATVAQEPVSDGERDTEAAGEESPSFLNTQAVVYGEGEKEGEETSSQPMSPELPLAAGNSAVTTVSAAVDQPSGVTPSTEEGGVVEGGGGEGRGEMVVEGSEEETGGPSRELEEVVTLQNQLLQSLRHTEQSTVLSTGELKRMKIVSKDIESCLREISAANQSERKRLASDASSLSQQSSQSGVTVGGSSESLRQRLTSLAARQKTLLQCFKTQKEVVEKLRNFEKEREKLEGMSGRISGAAGKLPHSCEQDGDSAQRRGPSAAIPNLLKHLKPPTPKPNSSNSLPTAPARPATPQNTSLAPEHLPVSAATIPVPQNQPQQLLATILAAQNKHHQLSATVPAPQGQPQQLLIVQPPRVQAVGPTAMGRTGHLPQNPTTTKAVGQGQTAHQTRQQGDTRPSTTSLQSLPPARLITQTQTQGSQQALSVPVALQTLLQHGFLEAGNDCLSCHLMGCEFRCSLLEDGCLSMSTTGPKLKSPNLWLQHCWAILGQHKNNLKTRNTYRNVKYRGRPLMSICEDFNRRQVSGYREMRRSETELRHSSTVQSRETNGVRSSFPGKAQPLPPNREPRLTSWSLTQLLSSGQVFLLDDSSGVTSLELPATFWEPEDVALTPQLVSQFEKDLDW